jgi:hypothetical protein
MDISKMTMTGHSYGGCTALKTSESEKRIRACLTYDPWTAPIYQEIVHKKNFTGFSQEGIFLFNTSKFLGPQPYWDFEKHF